MRHLLHGLRDRARDGTRAAHSGATSRFEPKLVGSQLTAQRPWCGRGDGRRAKAVGICALEFQRSNSRLRRLGPCLHCSLRLQPRVEPQGLMHHVLELLHSPSRGRSVGLHVCPRSRSQILVGSINVSYALVYFCDSSWSSAYAPSSLKMCEYTAIPHVESTASIREIDQAPDILAERSNVCARRPLPPGYHQLQCEVSHLQGYIASDPSYV